MGSRSSLGRRGPVPLVALELSSRGRFPAAILGGGGLLQLDNRPAAILGSVFGPVAGEVFCPVAGGHLGKVASGLLSAGGHFVWGIGRQPFCWAYFKPAWWEGGLLMCWVGHLGCGKGPWDCGFKATAIL